MYLCHHFLYHNCLKVDGTTLATALHSIKGQQDSHKCSYLQQFHLRELILPHNFVICNVCVTVRDRRQQLFIQQLTVAAASHVITDWQVMAQLKCALPGP